MSIISTAANYGGRVSDYEQNVKQYYVSSNSFASWKYKKLLNGLIVETPSDKTKPILIDNDLIVTGSIYNTSDKRLKKNIETINNDSIDELLKIYKNAL